MEQLTKLLKRIIAKKNRQAANRRRWQDPDKRAATIKKLREVAAIPEVRAKVVAANRVNNKSSQTQAKKSAAMKKFNLEPGVKERQSEASKKLWEDDNFRRQRSAEAKDRWQDKGYREKILSAQKRGVKDKYGTDNVMRLQGVRDKLAQTNIEKYGYASTLSLKPIRDKIKKTMTARYGVDNPSLSEEIKQKRKKTFQNKFGCDSFFSVGGFYDKYKDTMVRSCMETHGVPYFILHPDCPHGDAKMRSQTNRKWQKMLGVPDRDVEFQIENKSYDLKKENILIEINPSYTHNSTYPPIFGKDRKGTVKEKDYHLKKTQTAEKKGYRCVHVWDWDIPGKIVGMFSAKTKIRASDCEVLEIEREAARKFIDKYHLQGDIRDKKCVCIGLKHSGTVVAVMTFGKPRYNKNCEWELLRLCIADSFYVYGAATKMFNFFNALHNPKSVISYCDNSKYTGKVYEQVGFKKRGTNKPSCHWWNGKEHITDNLLRQRGFDQLVGSKLNPPVPYGKGTNNRDLMIKHGFVEIYDCGQTTYLWKKQHEKS